jgi:hypothetical protein
MAETQKKKRSWLFYGCSTLIVVVLLLAVLGVLILVYFQKSLTDTNPASLPTSHVSEEQSRQLRERVDSFRDAVQSHRQVPPLILTSDEVNALIATDPDCEPMKNHLHVNFEGNFAKAQFSFPTEQLGLPKGRYLNGTGTFTLSLRNGVLRLNAKDLLVKRRALPKDIAKHFENKNLADAINENPRAQAAFDRLQGIEIKDSKLVITPKKD